MLECDIVYRAVNKYMERNSGTLFPQSLILPLLDVYVAANCHEMKFAWP